MARILFSILCVKSTAEKDRPNYAVCLTQISRLQHTTKGINCYFRKPTFYKKICLSSEILCSQFDFSSICQFHISQNKGVNSAFSTGHNLKKRRSNVQENRFGKETCCNLISNICVCLNRLVNKDSQLYTHALLGMHWGFSDFLLQFQLFVLHQPPSPKGLQSFVGVSRLNPPAGTVNFFKGLI